MEDRHTLPVARTELVLTIESALRESRHLWPKTWLPGDHDRHRPMALAIVDHLDLCRMRAFRRPPPPGLAIMATAAHNALARIDAAEHFTIPIPRRDLEFSTKFALGRSERLWPKRPTPGGRDGLTRIATAMVNHLEGSGWRVFMAPPDPPNSPAAAGGCVGPEAVVTVGLPRPS